MVEEKGLEIAREADLADGMMGSARCDCYAVRLPRKLTIS